MKIAVIAEKPSVGRDIARALGATQAGEGFLEGPSYVVSWAIGHLVALAQPHQIDPAWKRWDLRTLPMLPPTWPLCVIEETRKQFEVVKKILRRADISHVVCATDAGREGELIFRYIYDAAVCKKPVERLWISSLTDDAIRDGFRRLRPARDFDPLADAAKGRSRADWLVGMNLSRAYSLALGEDFSVGRVQTPTLAMVVERELAIRAFVPEDYIEIRATFSPSRAKEPTPYEGVLLDSPETRAGAPAKPRRLPKDGELAQRMMDRLRDAKAFITKLDAETKRIPPPLLYDLTELQRHANRLFGMSAQKTLDIAQSLYERHKLISYPRTDSRHLSTDIAKTLPAIVQTIEAPYRSLLAPGTGARALSRRFVDDSKVSDHHAIVPTTTSPTSASLSGDEKKIYDLICRRLLAAYQSDLVETTTTVITETFSEENGLTIRDEFRTTGTVIEDPGWKVLDLGGAQRGPKKKKAQEADGEEERENQALPKGLQKGQAQSILNAKADKKRTKPPSRFTEGSLLTAMETAGKTLEEKELSDAMKDTGLGTPATRASIIETLLKREYVAREAKSLVATEKGIALVGAVHPYVKSPAMTGEWEARLFRLSRGEGELDAFLRGIEAYVKYVVGAVQDGEGVEGRRPEPEKAAPPMQGEESRAPAKVTKAKKKAESAPKERRPASEAAYRSSAVVSRPAEKRAEETKVVRREIPKGMELADIVRERFGFPGFRRYQEAVCRAVTNGQDVLLVMPTGAGKSLCYQLPGVARGGTTLVISPLIALMEDQVGKLRAQGFAAERIHSGRDRASSRAACVEYLAGRLDFLFIAPERLRVPGFPEMLAKRKPTLVAVDEAHCISHWGHDFRPDYRMLGERLPSLRPAPIIGLTATATPLVQDDIARELGLSNEARFIHGFRRTNIAIEVLELSPKGRASAAVKLLAPEDRRPAIVYASTRKHAEETAKELSKRFSAAAYHAGMETGTRDQIQSAFLAGELDVVVATIAFGMGVDKANVRTVVHTALPGSVESYYQEIGRAGRDGLPSRAILMHSFVDRRTHEFFFERDYPEPAMLSALYATLTDKPKQEDTLRARVEPDPEKFAKILEKLWIHGGAIVDAEGGVRRGRDDFLGEYVAQRRHKQEALAKMARFAEGNGCRMRELVRHFGDQADDGTPCGLCDICAADACIGRKFREPNQEEALAIEKILRVLADEDGMALGRLHRETFGDTLDRRSFDHIVGGLVRAGLVDVRQDRFQKGGEWIEFQRISLKDSGASFEMPEEPQRFVTLDDEPEAPKKKASRKGRSSKGKSSSKSFWAWKAKQKKKSGA